MINDFDSHAKYYDLFATKNRVLYELINTFMIKKFTENNIRTVLDFTCGTGAQTIPLAQNGFEVTGADTGKNLLNIAIEKSKGLNINYLAGDIRKTKVGEFDTVISILNSIGNLTVDEFEKAIINIGRNLRKGGLFVFDNTNKTNLENGLYNSNEIIDSAGESGKYKFVRFTKSSFDRFTGVLTVNWDAYVQGYYNTPEHLTGTWKRQTYSKEDLETLLSKHGFELSEMHDRTMKEFNENTTYSFLAVATKL